MDDRNAQVGWSDAQWNRVREEVLRAWQSVRVAGSFLPVYGPLPRSTQVVPSERLAPDGTTDDQAVAPLLEIALPVTLTRQQVLEEDLSSALLQFRRRAAQVGQLEDWFVFNGVYPPLGISEDYLGVAEAGASRRSASAEDPVYRPNFAFLSGLPPGWSFLKGAPAPIADPSIQMRGQRKWNPGALGLLNGTEEEVPEFGGPNLNSAGLMTTVVEAMSVLERNGYVAPFVCVFGRHAFKAAHEPVGESTAVTRDRLEPLIGGQLLHASAINVAPGGPMGSVEQQTPWWEDRGVLISLAGGAAADLAIAVEATPEFRQVNEDGRYVFSVFERFTLRIKDPDAIVRLRFENTTPTTTLTRTTETFDDAQEADLGETAPPLRDKGSRRSRPKA